MSTVLDSELSPVRPPASVTLSGIWKRLLWKDLRELLPIWVTLLLGAVVCAGLLVMSSQNNQAVMASLTRHTIVSGIQAFAIMASFTTGVLLFAPERERGTVHLLRSLPILPQQIVRAKLIAGLIGIVCVLLGLTVVLKFSLSGSSRQGDWLTLLHAPFWPAQLVRFTTLAFVFLLGAFIAMRSGSTFYGFTISAVIGFMAAGMLGYITLDINQSTHASLSQAVGSVIAVLVMLTGALTSGSVWLEERRVVGAAKMSSTVQETDLSPPRVPVGKPFWPLVWQSVRISRVPIMILFGFALMTLLVYCGAWLNGDMLGRGNEFPSMVTGVSVLMTFSATVCVCGTVFWHDQQRERFRFYQQHIERPRLFWLARLLPWLIGLSVAMLIGIVVSGIVWTVELGYGDLQDDLRFAVFGFITGVSICSVMLLSVFAIGQWWSMQIRNPIIGIVLTLISTIILWGVGASLLNLGESPTWFLPTITALFWATWFRSKSWLADSATWRTHAILCGGILISMGLSFAAYAYHRAYECPDLKLDAENIATHFGSDQRGGKPIKRLQFGTAAERKETADMYRQAIAAIEDDAPEGCAARRILSRWTHNENLRAKLEQAGANGRVMDFDVKVKAWVDRNRAPLDFLLKAVERVACDPFHVEFSPDQLNRLRALAMANSLVSLQQGHKEEALRCIQAYDRVCQRTNMAPPFGYYEESRDDGYLSYELLIRWAEGPDQSVKTIQKVIDEHVLNWNAYRRWGGEAHWFGLNFRFHEIETGSIDRYVALDPLMPWEKERCKRVLKREAIREFQRRQAFDGYQTFPHPTAVSAGELWDHFSRDLLYYGARHQSRRELAGSRAAEETIRRYTMLRLALAAYQVQHDSLPESIHDLAVYFEGSLPTTVYWQADFGWLPEGLPIQGFSDSYSRVVLPAKVPLLLPYGISQPIDMSQRVSLTDSDDNADTGIPVQLIDADGHLLQHRFDPVIKRRK